MNTINTKFYKLLTLSFAMLLCFVANAQDYTFKVISKKGSAKVGSEELKVGSKVQAGQQLTVGANTLLNIAHKNGKSLNITKAGSYKVDDLAKGCTAEGNSLASKYADFVLKELTSNDDDGVKGKNMRKPGSVVRDISGEDKATLVFAAAEKTMKVAPTSIALKCFLNDHESAAVAVAPEEVTKYTFVITNFMGEELEKIDSDKPVIHLDLSDEKYAKLPAINYYAYVNDNPKAKSAEYALQLMKGSEAKQITSDATMLAEDGSALSHLIQARYFEEKGLHANAIYAFEQALKKSEENDLYKDMYQAYLDRNYLSKKSKKKLKKDN